MYTYTYTHEDYVTHCVELYIYVEVSARNFKVCCMTVKVIPKPTSDCVLPNAGGLERSRGVNRGVNVDQPLRIRRGLCRGPEKSRDF